MKTQLRENSKEIGQRNIHEKIRQRNIIQQWTGREFNYRIIVNLFVYVWELDLKIKQFFLRERSEIIWRLKKIEELQIKEKWWAIKAKGRSAHLIVSIRASLQDKIDFYRTYYW